jgi:DNA-binding response OmpR family regulator
MKLLIEKEGETVSREEILEKVWGYHVFPSNRTVDNFMVRLRKYFENDPSEPKYLQSVRGTGYRFVGSIEGNKS